MALQTKLARCVNRAPSGQPNAVAVTTEVSHLLAKDCVVAVGVSGGKDSVACAIAVNSYLDNIGHAGPRVLIHADLGRVEWRDTLPSCERLALKIGWELLIVRRKAGDMLARWEGRWANSAKRYQELSCVKLILPWSTPSMRFCTSELKTDVITSALKRRFPTYDILNATGIRRQESVNRARMPISTPIAKLQRKGYAGLGWSPIIEWPVEDVLHTIADAGLPLHEAYTTYGTSRVSCAYCIMSSQEDLVAATLCADNHDLYVQMVELEAISSFAFQGHRWLADVAPHLLSPELKEHISHSKHVASLRQAIEGELPGHLTFSPGWPTSRPTLEDASLLASVRSRISDLIGLDAQFLTGAAVLERYDELLEIRRLKLV